MFSLSLRNNSDYICHCDYLSCFDFAEVLLNCTSLTFNSKISLFLFCLLRTLTLNHGIKYIHIYVLPVRSFSPDLPVTNGIVILGALFL